MPNTSNDDVIIVGSLSDKELRDSIDKLVDYVGDKTTIMAGKFDVAMEKMKSAMKDFAITQKVSVDLMQDAWKQMSASFDAMLKAQQNATSSGNNSGAGGNSQYADNTVGHLQEIIALEEKRRKEMTLGSDALRDQNKLIEEQKAKLRGETTSDQVKAAQAAKKELQEAFTMPARGLTDAERKLQQLQSLSAKFQGKGILDQTQWNRLNAQIQTTQEKIDKLRQKKPTSIQDVLGMDETSVDAIAKKMAALKNVTVDPQNTAQVKQLGDEYQRLKRLQAELLGQNIQMTHSNNYLAQSFGYIRNRLVYAMTLGAITSFTKQVYEIRGQYELLERSLGVLVNSFERGSQIFQELNQMAIESPFTLMELAGAAKQLTAYNFAANEVVDTTRRLADISAALGVPMERLTYNLGQIRAQTVLTARDARDFANAGLPIVASLAEHFTELEGKIVTTGDVYDRMSKKMVSYSDVMAVLNKMTDEGGKFFGFQAKQAETLRVQMANLNLAWNNMLNDIGKSNQGLLTLPISGLKALLQNWQTIDRVLKSILYTFIGWKALQMVAIRQQWAWATATGATAKQMGFLANAANGLFASMKALFLNPWTWVFVGIMAVIDLVRQTNAAREAMHELNQEIRDNANEASESMLNYLNNKGNQSTRQLAQQNKLTAEQGERAWESLKQQIEQSALSANGLIAELLAIEDINERVRVGFDYAERIQKAQAALQDLKDDSIEVNTDVGWFGMLGEGLVSDLKDYADYIEKYSEIARNSQMAGDVAAEWMHQVGVVKGARQEFIEELDDTAESINNFIRAYNITDPLQINEILERVRSQIKAKNPEIKGEAAKIFDISLDQKMAELTNGAVDRNASLWNMFMERLKHNSSSAFQDINDDWIKNNEALSSEQQAAVDANLQYFKDSMPYAYDAVAKMVSDASQLRIKIGITFGGTNATDFQKQVNERIANAPKMLDFGGNAFLPTNNDNLSSWVKTQQQAIKSLGEENKKYELDNSEWSKNKIKNNNTEIGQRKALLDLFHQQYAEEMKGSKGGNRKGGNRKPEDVVAEALKQELQLIREMQSNYDKLRKSGVSNMDAIDIASKGYEATIIRINKVLTKFGIDKFNAANFAGKDVRSLLQSLEEQRQALLASGKVKTSSLQALDVEIQKLTVDAKTYDMKKVTDGLNSELGKIKDEYELAVELDANPELGNMFANMFGITPDMLSKMPHTVGQLVDKYQDEIDKQLKGKFSTPFNILKTDINEWAKASDVDPQNELIKTLSSKQNEARGLVKKTYLDIQKMVDDYVKEYGNQQQQIEKIEKEKNNALLDLNSIYNTDALRQTKEYINAKEAIENAARIKEAKASFDALKKTTDYDRFFNAIDTLTSKDALAIKAKIKQGIVQAFKDGGLTVSEFRREIKALESQFDKLTESSSLWTNYLSGGFDKLIQKAKETGQEIETIGESISIKGTIDDKDKNFLSSLGSIFSDGNGGKMDITQLMSKFGNNMQGLGKAISGAGSGMQGAASKFSGAIAIVDTIIKNVHQTIQALGSVIDELDSVRNEDNKISNAYWEGFKKFDNYAYSGWENLKSGNVAGAIGDTANSIISVFNTFSNAKNEKINKQIKESERTVKDLENAYKNLSAAINDSIGNAEIKARRAAVENKKLQLTELERQLQLEQSRSSKRRDKDRIKELQGQIIDAKNEIKDLTAEITSTLLGNDIKSAAEDFVSTWVAAWRQGEDTMDALNKKFDGMIDNMIAKSVASYLVSKRIQRIFDAVDEMTSETSEGGAEITMNELKRIKNLIGDKSIAEQINQDLTNLYGALDIAYGVDSETNKNLSALQQGIQGVTEDTAGAIEAYMNIVAQRVFEQNLYLQEIRDHLNNFDLDVQLGTLSQMLLQLQQSYQVQQNIESILTGVLNPSGRAIVVELNS